MDRNLYVRVIGPPAFELDGQTFSTSSRKGDALLAYLAVSERSTISRQSAAGLLWSESSEDKARMSLRQVIRSIRVACKSVGYDDFFADPQSIELRGSGFRIDVQDLLTSIEHSEVPRRSVLHELRYSHKIFAGCDEFDPNFTNWLRVQRQIWSDRVMEALLQKFNETKELPAIGGKWAQALFVFDPSNEPAARYLMIEKASEGDYAGAIAIYDTLWQTLSDDFDTEPDFETQDVIADIKLGKVDQSRQHPVPRNVPVSQDLSEHPIIIVAPVDQSTQGEVANSYLQGMRSELISRLVKFREWSVVDWGADQKESKRPTYSIPLSAWREGGEIAYSLNLRDEHSGTFVWGQTIRCAEGQSPLQQHNFLQEIAYAVRVQVSADRLQMASSGDALMPGLYDAWIHAQQRLQKWRDADDNKALELLRFIVEKAPNFGPAHSAMAQFANGRHIVRPGLFRRTANAEFAYSHAKKALELDPLDARAHLSVGWTQALLQNFDEAESSFTSAIQLNPNDPWALISGTHGLAFCRSTDEQGVDTGMILDLDVDLAPEHWSYLAGIRFLARDFDGCLAASARAGQGYYGMKTWTISALSELGRFDEAKTEAEELYKLLKQDWYGQVAPSPENAGDWLAQMFPIRSSSLRQRIRKWLSEAGL
ncbi:BTAD domain-containing putative transcriptional regulator [Roseibium sp.]|uniref:BTAD domain-containing putative transcriptional regulator n=1 Tax=Roseibium sp. TaxID=1936156 RepID=UPI003B52A0A5